MATNSNRTRHRIGWASWIGLVAGVPALSIVLASGCTIAERSAQGAAAGVGAVAEEVAESDEDSAVVGTLLVVPAAIVGAAVGAVIGAVETAAENAEGEEPQTAEPGVGGDDTTVDDDSDQDGAEEPGDQ